MTATLTKTPVVATEVTVTNWTEDHIREYFALDDTSKALGKERNDVNRLRDSLLESFAILGQGEYRRMSASGIIALLGIDRSEDMVELYQFAGKVMTDLVKDEKTTAKKVWQTVNLAHKTKGYRAAGADKVLGKMPEGSTWGDWVAKVTADCEDLTDVLDPALTKCENTDRSKWNAGHIARLKNLARVLGFELVPITK